MKRLIEKLALVTGDLMSYRDQENINEDKKQLGEFHSGNFKGELNHA
jgi:hypothetical protein